MNQELIDGGILATAGRTQLTKEKLDALYEEVQSVYLADQRPWVIGYSGGKDSTAALQVIWSAISRLDEEQRNKRVYVLSSDTLVETPPIVKHVDLSLARINETAKVTGMPFEAHKVTPHIHQSFWVNLIGRGYPAPSKTFRWCTERMKIDPTNRFILDRVTEFGEVVVVLGARRQESATRAQVMKTHSVTGSRLKRHTSLPRAFVYTPVEDLSLDDVWSYLLTVPSPWGNDNKELVSLYLSAQAGECPLVIDSTTPSCGNSRFGCWVCTVVTKDKAIEALIDSGDDWMEPLLELRDWLAATQNPAKKREFRDFKRRDGRVILDRTKEKLVPGPYYLDTRRYILKRLLEAQKKIHKERPDETLILPAELHEIRRIWRMEEQDWEDSVPQIYRDAMGEDLDWARDDTGAFSPQDRSVLEGICDDEGVPAELVSKLLDVELELSGMGRRTAIYSRIERLLRQEWGSAEEALERALTKEERKSVEGVEA
jgi:DNA sulfur modification protein DndC